MMKIFVCLLSLALGASAIAQAVPEFEWNECTSWFVFNNLTKEKTNFLHKNRDTTQRRVIPMKSDAKSPRVWIGVGSRGKEEKLCMGMNASGLAVVLNAGELAVVENPQGSLGSLDILRECIVNCDTAKQVVEKIELLVKNKQFQRGKSGSIFLAMDTREAYIIDMNAALVSAARYDHGYACRANIWHNPGMAELAANRPNRWLHSSGREFMVIRDMNRALRANGKVGIFDMIDMARDSEKPEEFPGFYTLCNRTTNSSATFEISLTYPDVLSTGYFLLGPPRHTICVPVPICVEEYLPCMLAENWSKESFKRFDALKFNAPVPPDFPEFEKKSLPQYKAAQAEAEKLLAAGKRAEAVKLLNSTAKSIWLEADKIIRKHALSEEQVAAKKAVEKKVIL